MAELEAGVILSSRGEGDRSTFEADGQTVQKADARRVPAGGSEAKAASRLVEFGATAGHPLAQQQNFLANGRDGARARSPALLLDEMSDFLVAGPRLAARLVVAQSSRKTRCDGWGAMVGTLPKKQRPEERTPACSHSPRRPSFAVSAVSLRCFCLEQARLRSGLPNNLARGFALGRQREGRPYRVCMPLGMLTPWPLAKLDAARHTRPRRRRRTRRIAVDCRRQRAHDVGGEASAACNPIPRRTSNQ